MMFGFCPNIGWCDVVEVQIAVYLVVTVSFAMISKVGEREVLLAA